MKNYIVFDTETAPTIDCPKDGQAHGAYSNVYDFGYIVVADEQIVARRSFIITDTFFNDKMMNSAYYADKLPQYHKGIYKEWQPVSMLAAWRQFCDDCKAYKIKEVWAYNATFDKQALNRSIRDASNGFRSWFFPYDVKVRDIWDYAGATICNTVKFVKWCDEHGFMTDTGNPSTKAEIVYRYMTKDAAFIESHTALADAQIELEILQRVLKYNKKKPTVCGQGWRCPAKQYKKYKTE